MIVVTPFRVLFVSLLLCLACSARKQSVTAGTRAPVSLEARCRNGGPCRIVDGDLFFEVWVKNELTAAVEFPLELARRTGPSVRLVHARTGLETQLRTNLADAALRGAFTHISPGESVTFEWVIHEHELRQLGEPIDVHAEVVLFGELRTDGKTLAFHATDTLRIDLE